MEEVSFGIIPLRADRESWQVLLIQHRQGHWTFPKGRPEKGETPKETAQRELAEETGLTILRYLNAGPVVEQYRFQRGGVPVSKRAVYYLAIVQGEAKPQEEELSALKWVDLEIAKFQMTFYEGRALCIEIERRLKG